MNCSYGSSLSLSPQSFVPRRCLYSRPAAGFLCQQSTKEIVCDDYEEEWKKSYEKTIEVTSEAEIFVQRSPIMMMRTTPPASQPSSWGRRWRSSVCYGDGRSNGVHTLLLTRLGTGFLRSQHSGRAVEVMKWRKQSGLENLKSPGQKTREIK